MDQFHWAERARAGREQRLLIARGCLGVLLSLLIADLLCSLLVPILGLAQIQLVKNLLFPPPYVTAPVPIAAIAWGGKVYVPSYGAGTNVYDLRSGNALSTIPGYVVGSDERFLYTNSGKCVIPLSPGAVDVYYSTKLIARDSSGAAVWIYDNTPFTLSLAHEYGGDSRGNTSLEQWPQTDWQPQLQSDANSVYLLGTSVSQVGATTQNTSRVVALNKATGAVRWTYTLTSVARFVLARGALILLSEGDQPHLIALSASDGRQLWRQPTSSSGLFTDGRSVYLFGSQELRALSAQTGAQAWAAPYQLIPGRGVPFILDGSTIYLHDSRDQITAVNASNGRQLWRVVAKAGSMYFTLLAAQNGVVYTWQSVATDYRLSAVDSANGHTLWTWRTPSDAMPTVVAATGATTYLADPVWCDNVGAFCAEIVALNAQTGALDWSANSSQQSVSPSLVGQSLLIASQVQRYQVSTPLIAFRGPAIHTNCSYTTTLTSLSTATGAVAWSRSATGACPSNSGG